MLPGKYHFLDILLLETKKRVGSYGDTKGITILCQVVPAKTHYVVLRKPYITSVRKIVRRDHQ